MPFDQLGQREEYTEALCKPIQDCKGQLPPRTSQFQDSSRADVNPFNLPSLYMGSRGAAQLILQ